MSEVLSTPITEHFRKSKNAAPEHFNQAIVLKAKRKVNIYSLRLSLRVLCSCHEMLRATWDGQKFGLRPRGLADIYHLEEHRLERSQDVKADMERLGTALQSSIDLANGPLMRVALYHLSDGDYVLIAIHHLVVDGVSWRILVDDLNNAYQQAIQGHVTISLPKRTTSFAQYAEAIHRYAASEELAKEKDYWMGVANRVHAAANLNGTRKYQYDSAIFCLEEEVTKSLLAETKAALNMEINDLLLTALVRTWKRVMGQDALTVALEGHGREVFGREMLHLERTVGWFTTIYPVCLESKAELEDDIKTVQQTLAAIPNKGFGYGTLRHVAARGEELECSPVFTYNYLGSFQESSADDTAFFTFDYNLPKGDSVSPRNTDTTPFSINCSEEGGRLFGALAYDTGLMDAPQADAFVAAYLDELRQIVALAKARG